MWISITPRRKYVIKLVALGKSSEAIGAILGVGTLTVRNHLRDIAKAYGVAAGSKNNSRTMIVMAALVRGDLSLEELRTEYQGMMRVCGRLPPDDRHGPRTWKAA